MPYMPRAVRIRKCDCSEKFRSIRIWVRLINFSFLPFSLPLVSNVIQKVNKVPIL